MPKFTVFFKNKAINSVIFESGIIHIGRDDTNDLVVDSLAVAPAHAAVNINNSNSLIKQLNEKFPLIINGISVKEAVLQNNDHINIGKHDILFSVVESVLDQHQKMVDKDLEMLNAKLEEKNKEIEANLQIVDGPHIGRIISLKKNITRIGNYETGMVVIVRRKEGFYISNLEGNHNIQTVNKVPLEDKSILLKNQDLIEINQTMMQFFLA